MSHIYQVNIYIISYLHFVGLQLIIIYMINESINCYFLIKKAHYNFSRAQVNIFK